MASETMEQTPESTVTTEGEFQRMVSQLSTEEVDEYLQLWDEGGLTPSSELDSRDATVESADLEDDIEAIPQESSWSVSQEQEQRPTDTSEFFPKPPPRTTSKPEPCIENSVKQSEICQKPDQEDAQDYSVSQKKKFWEQISTSGEGADSKSSRQPESTVPPPVPRPRSSIVSTVSLLKSEAESDTETTNTTSDSTIRLKNVQQDALSKHSFTGSSDASDKEEVSEADATESILPASVPATVSSAVVESTEQDKQPIQSSSSDSESEKNLKSTDKPSPARKSLSLDTEKKSKIPVVATRKTVYERSVSLPTSDLDASISSVRAKKRYFEAQIKKEMVVDQLMTQLEEESSPEHKSINQKEHDKPTADPEAMVSRQIHSHIFSHELDEQIESLVPESKHILEAEEAVVGKPVTVTEVAETNNKVDARRTVKRTDSTLFEAEIVKLEPVIKEAEEESQITSDNVITNNVKNMRNIFEKFPEQQSIDKSIKEPAQYSPIESEIIFDQQNICNDHIGDKTSASISSMPETLQFKSGEFPNQISDSMEMHIDKSEIEESEKEKDNEESLKLAEHSNIVSDQIMPEEDEPIPSITVTLSGKQRTDSYSPGDSEDNESEADNVPEHFSTEEKDQNISQSQTKSTKMSSEKQEPCVHTPEEHIPDTVWEVPVQQEPETSEQEITHDIPIESQIIIEKDEEDSSLSDVKQFQNILNRNRIDISEEEAREIAQQVVEDIETKIAEKNIIIDSAKIKVDSSINKEVTEYFKQSAEEVDEKIIESVIAKKQREQIMKATRRDTTTSSMEITDEDLRSSGVDTDTSLIDSFSSKLKHLDERSGTDEACHLDNMRTDVGGVLGDKEVLEKTLAEVKESLEAAQEELIEEHKKKQDKIDKKESPSEFEFKVMAIDRLKDESIQECNNEDVLSTCDSEELVKTMSAQINSKSYGDETVDLTSFKEDLKGEGHAFDLGLQFGDKKSDIAKDIFIPEVQRQDLQDDTIDDSKKFKPKDDFPSSSSPILTTEKSKEFVSKEENYENTHSFEEQQKFELTRESHKEEKSEKKVSGHNYTSTEKLEFPSKKEKIIEAAITGEHKGFESEKTVSEFQESHNFIENEEKSDSYISERLSEIETQEHESNVFESSEQTEISLTTQESCETGEKQNIISNVHSEYPKFSPEIAKEEMRRTFSDDSQKSSQDESIKSPVGVEDALSSSSSSGRKGDSDTMHTLGKPGVVMRKHKTGISSAERVSSKHERRSGTDYEPYSSSGESHYQSFEQTSESIRTPSRPCSSDIEGLMVGVAGTTGSSEYESAISHEVSARSGTSHEFHTAVSSLSSRESMKSLDSESSGNLASVEISSEASETLVPSAMELERDMEGVSGPVSDYYTPPSRRFTEPYEMDIPHHVIRGESPHNICSMSDEKDSASFDNSADDLISEEDIELEKDKTDDGIPTKMKRSHEMIFLQDSRPASDSPVTEITDDKLASSLEEGTSVISSMSSVSENAVKTVLEVSRTESDKMDGSVTSDQLSLTVSGTSEQLSLSSESHDEPAVQKVNKIESSTSTQPTTYTNSVSSVTITTSMIKEQGIQSVCTQVTSQSESSKSEDIIQTEQISSHSNGPAAVEYKSEYDDIKETRRKPGHRRNESTTFKPSMIPILNKKSDSKSSKPVEGKLSNYIIEDTAESDKYGTLSNLTTKEGRNDEKKDIDESEKLEEESYQTEADQGFHREMREARLTLEDSAFCTEDEHEDIKDISASRLQSQISKSDSEGGQRHMSSEISDDRPDSELIELMKQCSSDATIDDPIERPRTPEPPEEPEIKDDTPEFSSEAQASITELELEYCGAFSRSVEYEAHISPIHEKPYISFEAQEHQDDMAEAEAAFHMVPHVSPTIPSVLPPTIPEDPIAEKHELETREIALKEEMRRRSILAEATSPGSIPDITVTQHLAPLIDREFHYPDLELEAEEVAATSTKEKSTPDTPASLSSKASTESEADQGREYIIDEPDGEDYIAEEPDTAEFSVTTEDKTEMETKHETIIERDSATNSPGSDSFELLEKPDLADDFVIIEEVGKEAQEQDVEGKSVKIGQRRVIKKSVPDDDIKSPPKPATKMTDLKYYPPVKDDLGPFPFESESPPTGDDVQPSGESEEGSPPSDEVQTYENEVEAGKKWIEMQFQGEQAAAVYGYEFEHGPLEDIKEEEATDFESSSKIGSVGSQVSHSVGSFGSVKESLSSTPDYDVLAGRKYFTRSGEHDDVSMSSLQEFERIEHMIALESTKNKSLGSQDSLSGSGGSGSKKHGTTRSGGDDISLSSLKEFEGLEMACIAAERIESKAKEEEALLSEIEEGHESQASESESCETISAGGIKGGDSDSDDYEKRMFEIDEIIRQAQTNVERFTDVKDPTEVSFLDKTESVGRGDSLEEVAKVPDLDLDQPLNSSSSASKAYDSSSYTMHWVDESRQTTDSLDKGKKLKIEPDQFTISTDSLDMKTGDKTSADAMSASTDSIEYQLQQKKSKGRNDLMTDSIELSNKSNIMSDSLDLDTVKHTDSIEDDDEACGNVVGAHDQSSSSGREGDLSSSGKEDSGEHNRIPPPRAELMLGSTDSLEPTSSTATHATYHYETDSIMSSSFTSGGSNTMVSSTETLDAAARAEVWFEDGKPYVTEVIEPETDGDFSHIIHRTVELPPEIHKVTFQGPDADKALREYVDKFGPGEDMSETQHVDEHGNVHIKRVVQRRVVIKPEQMTGAAAGLSGPELEQYIKHLSEEQMLGEMEPLVASEEQSGVTESDYSHLLSSATSPPDSSESHQEYFSRHVVSRSTVSSPSTSITTTKKEISLIQQKGRIPCYYCNFKSFLC
ncbi:hypothetical protein LSTR_LSTR014990 [Laodelphax striatellus]|uniref:Death domain-containing protein n=1 Tax=Laodelphax striatellus TaxID=195883 RepID=A0A482WUW5_LAOST|nr:hypothetical protein LSTR_LSTR014990 [Laodelphax striatellus]